MLLGIQPRAKNIDLKQKTTKKKPPCIQKFAVSFLHYPECKDCVCGFISEQTPTEVWIQAIECHWEPTHHWHLLDADSQCIHTPQSGECESQVEPAQLNVLENSLAQWPWCGPSLDLQQWCLQLQPAAPGLWSVSAWILSSLDSWASCLMQTQRTQREVYLPGFFFFFPFSNFDLITVYFVNSFAHCQKPTVKQYSTQWLRVAPLPNTHSRKCLVFGAFWLSFIQE